MADEENVAQELHGHLTQMLRTTLSGGFQMTEQRARRRQHEAESERRLATEAARQLEERKRAERAATALLSQENTVRQREDRTEFDWDTTDIEDGSSASDVPERVALTTEPPESVRTLLDLEMDMDSELRLDPVLDLDAELDLDPARSLSGTDIGR